jgi:hypothetical protein
LAYFSRVTVPFPSRIKNYSKGINMSQDEKEVRRVVTLYIDGAGNGNADQMNEAFHSSARWFGTMDGVDYDMDKEGFVAYMVETPGLPSKAEIVDIQIDGSAARATVKEEGFWETISFTNFFNLSILDGRWQITNKTFAATGGGHA